MEQLSMAIIGTGLMGRQYAGMINSGAVPHMRLGAVCCRSDEACRWAEETLDREVWVCRSAQELYGHPEMYDGILIVTPHCSHMELAETAFGLGKHVFCDKPSGLSVEEAGRMNQAAERSGRKFAIMFHQRLYTKHRRIKEIIESGEMGEIQRISMESTESYRTWTYHSSGSWRSTWRGEGGGVLINQGQHLLDLWQWLFGMPEEVYGQIQFGKYNDFAVDDEAGILMKYGNGVTGSFFVSTGEARGRERLEVTGSRAALLMEGDTITVWRYSQDSREYGRTSGYRTREGLLFTETKETWPVKKDYEQMLENFALAALEGAPLIAPGEEGYKALELANSAYLSAWLGRPVQLPLDAGQYEAELRKKMEEERQRERGESGVELPGARGESGVELPGARGESGEELPGARGESGEELPGVSGDLGGGLGQALQSVSRPPARLTTLCYLERDGRYLMLHRVSKKADENKDKWIGVGGHVEEGESPEDCLLREVREETGLTLTSYRFRGLVTFVSDEWGTEYMCLYTADKWTGEMTECREGTLEWVEKERICELNIWEGDKVFFRLLEEERPFFSLKLRYEGEVLREVALKGVAI